MRAHVAGAIAFFKPAGTGHSPPHNAGPPAAARASPASQAAPGPYLTPGDQLLGSRAWLITASGPWR